MFLAAVAGAAFIPLTVCAGRDTLRHLGHAVKCSRATGECVMTFEFPYVVLLTTICLALVSEMMRTRRKHMKRARRHLISFLWALAREAALAASFLSSHWRVRQPTENAVRVAELVTCAWLVTAIARAITSMFCMYFTEKVPTASMPFSRESAQKFLWSLRVAARISAVLAVVWEFARSDQWYVIALLVASVPCYAGAAASMYAAPVETKIDRHRAVRVFADLAYAACATVLPAAIFLLLDTALPPWTILIGVCAFAFSFESITRDIPRDFLWPKVKRS